MPREYTLTLDDETIQQIESAPARLGKSQSEFVQEAIAHYRPIADRLSEAERQQMLRAMAILKRLPPSRPDEEVKQELEEIRAARRSGGRRTRVE